MKTPRFNNGGQPHVSSRFGTQEDPHPKWIRISHISHRGLRDLTGSGRRKIFAIVAPPKPGLSRKPVQRILVFDNHPDSLRLAFESHATFNVDPAPPRHTSRRHVRLGLVLILTLVLAMVWSLIWSLPLTRKEGAIDAFSVASQNLRHAQ